MTQPNAASVVRLIDREPVGSNRSLSVLQRHRAVADVVLEEGLGPILLPCARCGVGLGPEVPGVSQAGATPDSSPAFRLWPVPRSHAFGLGLQPEASVWRACSV